MVHFGPPRFAQDSYEASESCVMDGDVKTGLITIFMVHLEIWVVNFFADCNAEMHGSPLRFGLMPFQNMG
jgi:hypothetical protein